MSGSPFSVVAASTADPRVLALLDALTAELASEGYTASQTFGFSAEQIVASGVHLVAVAEGEELVGVGGIQAQAAGLAELKRFYVRPGRRGAGVAQLVLDCLLDHARDLGVRVVRLETGDRQHRALAFYRRNGFDVVPAFPPYVGSETPVCLARTVT